MISEAVLMDNMEYMAKFPDNFFDLAPVDPPYGINALGMNMGSHPNRSRNDGYGSAPSVSTCVKVRNRLNGGSGTLKNRILNKSKISWDDQTPTNEYFCELFRVSKNQIIWGGNYFDLPPTRCVICWDKMQPWENFSQWEMAWTNYEKPASIFRYSNTGGANTHKKIHPTQKPIKLYYWIYSKYLPSGGKVLDTHLGSGSSRIAADYAGNIDFYSCENNPDHYNDQEKRYQEYKKQLVLKF